MKKLKAILIGAGLRGITYTDFIAENRDKFELVAVAEPADSRRNYIKHKHALSNGLCFTDYKPLLEKGKIADVAIIATMDRDHFEPVMEAIRLGYDILLEKPIAPTPRECEAITSLAEKMGSRILVCHVLRFTPFFVALKEIIDSGKIGEVVSISQIECVGNEHQSHSFVRGNWGNEKKSSFMLLQKSCHDMDILQWLIGTECRQVQSFGSLTYFTEKNAPNGAPDYCIEGCPVGETCPYNAVKLYLKSDSDWFRSASTKMVNPNDDDVKKAISSTQYGKCVFRCDNNVVDHQVVNLLFDGGVTVSFTMCAFNKGGRTIHIMGTKGEIEARLEDNKPIQIYTFADKAVSEYDYAAMGGEGQAGGHSGGDEGIMEAFYNYIANGEAGKNICTVERSLKNHYIAFAAEHSRRSGAVINVEDYMNSIKNEEDYSI